MKKIKFSIKHNNENLQRKRSYYTAEAKVKKFLRMSRIKTSIFYTLGCKVPKKRKRKNFSLRARRRKLLHHTSERAYTRNSYFESAKKKKFLVVPYT